MDLGTGKRPCRTRKIRNLLNMRLVKYSLSQHISVDIIVEPELRIQNIFLHAGTDETFAGENVYLSVTCQDIHYLNASFFCQIVLMSVINDFEEYL